LKLLYNTPIPERFEAWCRTSKKSLFSILGFGRDNNTLTSYKSIFSAPWQQTSQGLKRDRSTKRKENMTEKIKGKKCFWVKVKDNQVTSQADIKLRYMHSYLYSTPP
jgi:hypothetical protein